MTFLEAVNRILQQTGILRGDDDALASFGETQHATALAQAKIAIQDQLTSLVADEILDVEAAQAEIDLVASTRLYQLATDFHKFRIPSFLEVDGASASENTWVTAWPKGQSKQEGDEKSIAVTYFDYQEASGDPNYWYWSNTAHATVGFYPVPDSPQKLRYYYEKEVNVSVATDDLPFYTESQAQQFTRLAARHFELIWEGNSPQTSIDQDPGILNQRGNLMLLLDRSPGHQRYGN